MPCQTPQSPTSHPAVHCRSGLVQVEGWRANNEGWCARTDATIASLAEDSRILTRRCQTQHQAIGELSDRVTHADLSSAVSAALKAAETATETALAPVRVRFEKIRGCDHTYEGLSLLGGWLTEKNKTKSRFIACPASTFQVERSPWRYCKATCLREK